MPPLIVSSGQTWVVSSGITDTADTILFGGIEIVSSGGRANGNVIAGGYMSVTTGGVASFTNIDGGTLEILSGGTLQGSVVFNGTGGTLRIDGTTMPTGVTINGSAVGNTIDLAGVSFANGGSIQLGALNGLTLIEGGATYTLQLSPGQSYAGDSFRLVSDGHGGTDIQVVSGLSINVTYDASVASAPAGFKSGVNYAVSQFESLFTNGATVNIAVGYGEAHGNSLPSNALGESQQAYFDSSITYSAVRSALIAEGAPGAATLPVSSPTSRTLNIGPAEAKALGLVTSTSSSFPLDGYVGFSTSNTFSYSGGVTPSDPNSFYFVGVVEHEISEVMGRISRLNGATGYTVTDLFRYAAAGVRQLTSGSPSYFSIDGGVTSLDGWNNFVTGNTGDLADWDTHAGFDAFNDGSAPGVINALTSADIVNMAALGWTVISTTIGSGGLLNIRSGGIEILDDSVHFSGSIAGLATSGVQNVDLVDIAFASLTLAYTGDTASGVLSASDGLGHTALLNMIGNYTLTNFNTKAADDGHGGTMITDPPVSSGAGVATPH